MYHSRGPGRLIPAAKGHENKPGASKSWPRKAYCGRQGPRKQTECSKIVAPEVIHRPDLVYLSEQCRYFYMDFPGFIVYNRKEQVFPWTKRFSQINAGI